MDGASSSGASGAAGAGGGSSTGGGRTRHTTRKSGRDKEDGNAAAGSEVDGAGGSKSGDDSGNSSDSDSGSSSSSSSGSSSDSSDSDGDDGIEMVLHGQAVLRVREFNDMFVCLLCKGYMRDCHTITECLHSFCGSCLKRRFLDDIRTCPRCHKLLGAQPHEKALPDHTMQKMCDIVLPQIARDDAAAERKFNEDTGFTAQKRPAPKPAASEVAQRQAKKARKFSFKSDARSADQMSVKLMPLQCKDTSRRLEPLEKPLLKTSVELRIEHLRKHVARRLSLSSAKEVDIMCKGQVLGPELSLEFIHKTRWRGADQMVLHFRRNKAFLALQAVNSGAGSSR